MCAKRYSWLQRQSVKSVDSQSITFQCSPDGLEPELLARLETVAAKYHSITGESLIVTAGLRTLQRQAELMANFSQEQLEAMYCRNGYPSYISQILALPNPHDPTAIYNVLANRTEGYISKHLYGKAADIAAENMASPQLFKELCAHANLSVLDETNLGVPCFHIALTS